MSHKGIPKGGAAGPPRPRTVAGAALGQGDDLDEAVPEPAPQAANQHGGGPQAARAGLAACRLVTVRALIRLAGPTGLAAGLVASNDQDPAGLLGR